MTTGMMIGGILLLGILIGKMEARAEDNDFQVTQLLKEARYSRPRAERNPARFGTVGYTVPGRGRRYGRHG